MVRGEGSGRASPIDIYVQNVRVTVEGRSLAPAADIFNVLNLLNSHWGRYRAMAPTDVPTVMLLQLAGYDAANGRGRYRLLPARDQIVDAASRWQVQLGVRYEF